MKAFPASIVLIFSFNLPAYFISVFPEYLKKKILLKIRDEKKEKRSGRING